MKQIELSLRSKCFEWVVRNSTVGSELSRFNSYVEFSLRLKLIKYVKAIIQAIDDEKYTT